MPRCSCRIVLVDDGDGVGDKAARRLGGLGYTAVDTLAGGVDAWSAAGFPLFPSTNVPSKAFAELVEIDRHTPHVTAAELAEMQRAGRNLKILDSRTIEEFNRFHVPGAVTCPGAELVYRFADLVPDPETLVVVSCAGRTRSIIGAQSLINAGVPNKIVSLQGGTQAWRLAGLDLERNTRAALAPVSREAAAAARRSPLPWRKGSASGGSTAPRSTNGWARRSPHDLPARRAHAGGIHGRPSARLDLRSGRAIGAGDRPLGRHPRRPPGLDRRSRAARGDDRALAAADGVGRLRPGAAVRRPGAGDRRGSGAAGGLPRDDNHDPGSNALARWGGRLGGDRVERRIPQGASRGGGLGDPAAARPSADRCFRATRILVFAEDEAVGGLAAADLGELAAGPVALVEDGVAGWRDAGRPMAASPDEPPDDERIDYVFWNHDRHEGNQDAMRAYLQWELDLPGEIAKDGLAGFRLGAR